VVDRLIDALKQVEGAYSLVALSKALIGVRDPLGVRPLVLGIGWATAWVLAARPARWTSSAPNSCATSSPARSW
jgi:glutamine phosphoribosylpyrophosphate amidotransferase